MGLHTACSQPSKRTREMRGRILEHCALAAGRRPPDTRRPARADPRPATGDRRPATGDKRTEQKRREEKRREERGSDARVDLPQQPGRDVEDEAADVVGVGKER
jgi:hypothetical protein